MAVLWLACACLTSCNVRGADAKSADVKPASLRLQSPVPVIGAWFPQENEMRSPDGYRDFLDAAAEHSHYTLLSTTMRNRGRQMVDPYVHDWFKRAAQYAKDRGMGIVLEMDPRHSISAFKKKYPNALQQRLWLQEVDLKKGGEVVANVVYNVRHGDAICGAGANGIELERVYSYTQSPNGAKSGTVKDITASCEIRKGGNGLSVAIPGAGSDGNLKACVIARVTFNYPAAFAPETIQFEADTAKQYGDCALAGLMKDEWGYPACHRGNPHKNGFWTSSHREEDYAKRTGGGDLVRDSLLMFLGEEGRQSERQAAINHFMEQSRFRHTEIEHAFYTQTKALFGPTAFVGTHDTVFPYPDAREFERNGLNWWTATRDFGQSDEITPYCCRTSLAKKFGGAVWFNQWYSGDIGTYERNIWSYVLAGGRMNFHGLYPAGGTAVKLGKDLLRSDLMRGDSRIRLLNNISDAPVDCPVAVIFGHPNVMNWAGPSFNDIGTQLTDAFWRAGIYADLIPSSEITGKVLRVDAKGEVWFGKQRYSAVVLYNPEFENTTTADFFQKAARGKALLYRLGEWTKDFNGKPLDGKAALPTRMKVAENVDTCAREIIAELIKSGVEAVTPSRGDFPKWSGQGRTSVNMPAAGRTRLTDGTVIHIAGEKNVTGDPIQKTIQVNGHEVTFDAVGVAAIRLSKDGKLEAMAAAGLKHFKTGSVEITLDQPADVALWQEAKGKMQGVLQDYQGPVPADLKAITPHWLRLDVPTPIPPIPLPPRLTPTAKSVEASSQSDATCGAGKAHDGILSCHDNENFWASANNQDVGSWWQADMGQSTTVEEIQIQFREIGGNYHFVPKTITFQVSDDGKDWTTVVSKSAGVPANNSPHAATMHTYDINAAGRYVRLLFEDGTEDTFGGFKVVELVEVKVIDGADPGASNDSARVRLPADVPPVIGCWFPVTVDREPENFKPFLDHVTKHTAYNLLTTSIRIGARHMSDQDVHDAFKAAVAYGRKRGIGIVPELGVWSSFNKAYPEETLNRVRLQTVDLAGEGEVIAKTDYPAGAHTLLGAPFKIGPAKIARVYSYVRGAKGVDPGTVKDITAACKVREVTSTSITVAIPCNKTTRGRQACVLFEIPLEWPDPFNPHLPQHQRDHLGVYADVELAGACLDEFGLPAFAKANELWCSPHWSGAYAKRTKGRDLLRDMVLMVLGEKGRDAERYAAVNHYMEMTWQQIAAVEEDFYKATKDIFGAAAFVGTHATWQPHLNALEARRNGWDWWAVRRDYGQTDETTPFCVRTALAKKWGKPVGYNMYYSTRIADYERELWVNALAGFRVNYHPVYPAREDGRGAARKPLWRGGLMRGDCRVRMLNFISKTQVDCPVAVIFGHAGALNWAGASYADAGDGLAQAFWKTGFYADLIPSSEIESGALRIDEEGRVRYGDQTYSAVVLYQPEFERPSTGEFFRKAAKGKTALYRIGDWSKDFDGASFDGKAALPSEMNPVDAKSCVKLVTAKLSESGILPQTAGTPAPPRSGQSRLIDGTVIMTAGEKDPAGDAIQKTITVKGLKVTFDAIGIAAVRLDKNGKLEAMAAGGLKSFQGGGVNISVPTRADVALWKDKNGVWQGVLQDYEGAVPENLAEICTNWLRLEVPTPLE